MTSPAASIPRPGRRPTQAGAPFLMEYTGTPRPGWRHHTACDETSAELFFPDPASGNYDEQVQEAKRICASCIVRTDCLAYAFAHGEEFGIWGGLDETERKPSTHQAVQP